MGDKFWRFNSVSFIWHPDDGDGGDDDDEDMQQVQGLDPDQTRGVVNLE